MTDSTTHTPFEANPWQAIYLCTLDNMRQVWPHDWPGLPVVVQACIHRLWPNSPPEAEHTSGQLLAAATAMAHRIETLALAAPYEPHYHNRLHTADALTAVCLLIQSLQQQHYKLDDDWVAALLLAVTSHDVRHPGGANGFLQEFEQQSVQELQQVLADFSVEKHWPNRVSEMILRTDPTLVASNHDKVKNTAFVMNMDWACVLINEADILASATAHCGPDLGRALSQEWALKNHPLHHVVGTPSGRLHFLSSLRFSTPASEAFQIAPSVQHQIHALQKM